MGRAGTVFCTYSQEHKFNVQTLSDSLLTQLQQQVGKPATFNVNFNGAHGELKAHVDTPSGAEDDCFIQELDQELYALRFMPKENGIYYVHVKLNEAHIPNSPFPMLIGKMASSPELVMARGDGLEKADCGEFDSTDLFPGFFNIINSLTSRCELLVYLQRNRKMLSNFTLYILVPHWILPYWNSMPLLDL